MKKYDKLPFFKNLIPGQIYWVDTVSDFDILKYITSKIQNISNDYEITYSDDNIILLLANLYTNKFSSLIASHAFEQIAIEMKKLYPRYDLKFYRLYKNARTETVTIRGSFLPCVIITSNKTKWTSNSYITDKIYVWTPNEYLNSALAVTFNTIIIDENKTSGYETLIKLKDFNRVIFIYPKSKIDDHTLLRYKKNTTHDMLMMPKGKDTNVSILHIIKLFHTFFKIIAPNYDYCKENFDLFHDI